MSLGLDWREKMRMQPLRQRLAQQVVDVVGVEVPRLRLSCRLGKAHPTLSRQYSLPSFTHQIKDSGEASRPLKAYTPIC